MSALKIQKAVNENLLVLYGKCSLGFDKKEKEDKTRRRLVPPNLQIHTWGDHVFKKQTNKKNKTKKTKKKPEAR